MEKYSYKTNEINNNLYDIFEIGGDVICWAVPWKYVEFLVKALNEKNE